jgi:hypothetical protein
MAQSEGLSLERLVLEDESWCSGAKLKRNSRR